MKENKVHNKSIFHNMRLIIGVAGYNGLQDLHSPGFQHGSS